jgi:hypothetical protein
MMNLSSVYFTDANNGYIAGDNGTILKTTDGGTDFIEETSPQISAISLYPNPAEDLITIKVPMSANNINGSISIYGITGEVLIQQNMPGSEMKIKINSLTSGIYFVKYISQGYLQTVKFVKE